MNFQTVQELWNYCQFCPVCQISCREIDVSVGPDYTFSLESYEKKNTSLILNCKSKSILCKYVINCSDNSFEIQSGSNFGGFFFYLQSHCGCGRSATFSYDLEVGDRITNIAVEAETVSIPVNMDESYYMLYDYEMKQFMVKHYSPSAGKNISIPMFDVDYSDKEALISKIKTYVLFS